MAEAFPMAAPRMRELLAAAPMPDRRAAGIRTRAPLTPVVAAAAVAAAVVAVAAGRPMVVAAPLPTATGSLPVRCRRW